MAQKREIDKEAMFRKIMPSSATGGEGSLAVPAPAPQPTPKPPPEPPRAEASNRTLSPDEIAALFAQAQGNGGQAAEETPAAPPEPPRAEASNRALNPDEIAALFAQAQGDGGQAAEETPAAPPEPPQPEPPWEPEPPPEPKPELQPEPEPPQEVNLAELFIQQAYGRYRARLNACACERCREEACALALSRVQPRYVYAHTVNKHTLCNRELAAEAVTALVQAIFTVRRNPHQHQSPA